jgi:hypothetical protein
MAWDETSKARAVELYLEREPTAENSMEVVKEVADEMEESVNGVRMILTKAGVYIKKAAPAAKSTGEGGEKKTSGTRVSKEDAHNQLTEALGAHNVEADAEIISKLTGKAALYFAGVLVSISS